MADDVVVKVTRRLFPRGEPAVVTDQAGSLVVKMHLPENVTLQLGGENMAYFKAIKRKGSWELGPRVAAQKW